MNDEILTWIQHTAATRLVSDHEDFNPCDYAGGNYDDAYTLGVDDGYVLMARELLKKLNGG